MDMNKLKNLGGSLKDVNPADIMGKMSIPDCQQTPEYGVHTNEGVVDSLHDVQAETLDVESITVHAGAIVDGITLVYRDGTRVRLGTPGGSPSTIVLGADAIRCIRGQHSVNFGGRRVISQLVVETTGGKAHGPFGGNGGGTVFTLSGEGVHIAGLFGSSSGGYLASLGAYLMK